MSARAAIGGVRPRRQLGAWFIAPAAVLLAAFVLWPLVRTFQLSAFASDLIGNPTRFVGLGNYISSLTDPSFLATLGISIAIALLGMTLATSTAIVVVVLLRRPILGHRVFDVLFSLPFAYSAASASVVFAGLFAPSVGALNILLSGFGITGPAWLETQGAAIWAISIATAWYEFGFAFLVLTAAIRDIPTEIVEAGQLDGAGAIALAREVLLPMMRPSILFLVVTQTISGLQTFAQVQVLTRGGPAGGTTTLVYRVYQLAFGNGVPDFGRASVTAITLVLVIALVSVVQFRILGGRAGE